MDVISSSALPVSSLCWQPRAGLFALTVVCKVTFLLRPGESNLASQQIPPLAADVPLRGDPHGTLAAAGDLAPFKPRCEVFVVGSATAPDGRAVMALAARLRVGSIDKIVEARAVPPALALALPPGGLGPIAASWPMRAAKLPRRPDPWDPRLLATEPLPAGLDPTFFNVAPPDQQLDALRADEEISLEHLHPEHARLTTRLVPVVPSAVVERPGAPTENVVFRCDTLMIDADHGLASLTWRASIPLASATEPGRIVVSRGGERAADAPTRPREAAQTMLGGAAPGASTPFLARAGDSAPPQRPGPVDAGRTVNSFVASRPLASPATSLPFHAEATPVLASTSPPQARRPGPVDAGITLPTSAMPTQPALPFGGSPPPPSLLDEEALSPPTPRMPARPPLDVAPAPAVLAPAPLPAPHETAAVVAAPEAAAALETESERPLPLAAYPIERCAAIAASLGRRRDDFAAILETEQLDAALWARLDQRWVAALSADAERGDSARLDAYDAAYVARIEAERGPITPEEYARLPRGAERGRGAAALTAHSLPRGAMPRIDRTWIRRQAEDPALARAVRAAIRAARAG